MFASSVSQKLKSSGCINSECGRGEKKRRRRVKASLYLILISLVFTDNY